ncbi:cytokine receptor common subunit beta isoform X1 [Xyrichtys novacula]|uniref:Cytokine receptor common subunit beta isoform X1 n=1 Tax=Xyrichtys novacula TaxID=13765 RepID=A0AAV1GQF0_XYRNO|nr:cytokine receptor common subunit beta isoform X1 [Xyrichtys novacula]
MNFLILIWKRRGHQRCLHPEMMTVLWVALWALLPTLALTTGPNDCVLQESSTLQHESPLLKFLVCHNDYESYVHCKWEKHGERDPQLWFKTDNNNELCEPFEAEGIDPSENRTVQCRYQTRAFAISIEHTVFFLDKKTQCSSVHHKTLDLTQHLRARTPVNLSTHETGDGGRWIGWTSPYSSSLNQNITYQLSYKKDTQDHWTRLTVSNTSVKLQELVSGQRYEAKVRARTRVGQWSDWTSVVTWRTEDDKRHFPSMHCVLYGENEVTCSWELSTEIAQLISYQLSCRRNQTAPSERCCVNQTVTSDPSGTVLKYSCWLTVTDPEHLLLELQQTRNAKIFKAHKHIQPKPPQQVQVKMKGSSWRMEWTEPSTVSKVRLYYQVCYYRTGEQVIVNVSMGNMFLNLPDISGQYMVKVRSLVDPGTDFTLEGIPSEWSPPVEWISHEAWSPDTLIYCSIGAFVATVFLTLYCTIPACRRKVVLWVDSIPSPGKSRILSEIKSETSQTLMQSESTSFCKVQHSESVSTCSSDAPLWSTKDAKEKFLEQDETCWTGVNVPVSAEVVSSDTSSISFSGPYIFCQSELNRNQKDVTHQEKEEHKIQPNDSVSPSPVDFTLFGDSYVSLPSRGISRSTQDLVSHSSAGINRHRHDSAEQDQQSPDPPLLLDHTDIQPSLNEPNSCTQPPPPYISVAFTSWPQGGAIQPSGYCHIPTALINAEK